MTKLKGQLEGSIEKSQRKMQELEREMQTHKQEIETLKRKVNTGLEQEVARLGRQQKWQWEEFQRKTQEFEKIENIGVVKLTGDIVELKLQKC